MQFKDIEYVLALAKHRNFSKAAQELYITQPALSQAIMRLEQELGLKLFNRQYSSADPTPACYLLLEEGENVLLMRKRLLQRMEDVKQMKTGRLKIGLTKLISRFYLPDAYREFHRLYPGIELILYEYTTIDLEEAVEHGDLDLAIFPLYIRSERAGYIPLTSEAMYLAVPTEHPVNAKVLSLPDGANLEARLRDFRDDDFILLPQGFRTRAISDALFAVAGFTPHIVFETQQTDTVNALVSANMGVGIVPDTAGFFSAFGNGCLYYKMTDVDASQHLVAAYNQKLYLSNAAQAFADIFRSTSSALRGHLDTFYKAQVRNYKDMVSGSGTGCPDPQQLHPVMPRRIRR